jgi:hypothetical protein
LIKGVFHKQDQDLLRLLENIDLGDYALGDAQIKGLSVTLAPHKDLSREDFNYRLSLDQSKYLGIESDELHLSGTGKIVHDGNADGEDFTLSGPVSNFKVSFDVKSEADFQAGVSKIAFKSIDFTLPAVDIKSESAAFKEHGHTEEVRQWVNTKLSEALHTIRSDAFLGKDSVVSKLPAVSIAPLVGLYFAAFGADKMLFTDEFIEYEFSPVSMKLVKEANLHPEFLSEIQTAFEPKEEGEEESALQLIFDQNLVNGIIG